MKNSQISIEVASIVGADNVIFDDQKLATYGTDHSKVSGNPLLAVTPRDKYAISNLLSYCNSHNLVVVPSGGRTGLAGGATAQCGEIIISMEKMNRIDPVDPINMCITVEAGAITEEVQQGAREGGFCFPIDLASRGSSHIGGNIATNAGGMKVLRYGMTRESVLGIEVVLPDGTFLDLNQKLIKNNTGYDLKHLFIGSEGTLGVITEATLRLKPLVKDHQLVVLTVSDAHSLMDLLDVIRHSLLPISAFEIMLQKAFRFMIKNGDAIDPFNQEWPFYCFVEFEITHQYVTDIIGSLIEHLMLTKIVTDGIRAMNSDETKRLWKIRENISDTVGRYPLVEKNDISLPINTIGKFIMELEALLTRESPQFEVIVFGHLGDGNLHINLIDSVKASYDEFTAEAKKISDLIFEIVAKFQGSISAEHGIGLLKKSDLHYSRSPLEISLMQKIKALFDPNNIMNKGKIF